VNPMKCHQYHVDIFLILIFQHSSVNPMKCHQYHVDIFLILIFQHSSVNPMKCHQYHVDILVLFALNVVMSHNYHPFCGSLWP